MRKRNNNLGLFRQIEELALKVDALTRENAVHREENRILRDECESIRASFTAELEKEKRTHHAECESIRACFTAELDKAHAEIDRLKAQLNKNSSNSSKPPSQNGLKKIPNSREKSDRKSGGQPGHPGKSLKIPDNLNELLRAGLAIVEDVDHTVGSEGGYCDTCYELDFRSCLVIRRHFYPLGKLPPENRNRVVYGGNVKALTTYLSARSHVSHQRIAELISHLSHGGINLSDASISNFLCSLAKKLAPELDAIKTDLLNGAVLHVDETPMDVTQKPDYSSGEQPLMRKSSLTSFNACVRTHSNDRSTLLTANPQKDMQGCTRDQILTSFVGILSHDHESKFYHYGTDHATCCAHLQRELKRIFEQKIAWGNEMSRLFSAMNAHKNEDLKAGKVQCSPDMLAFFENRFDEVLQSGRATLETLRQYAPGSDDLRKIIARLISHKDCYLRFLRDYRAPFTNNLAERDLRPSKTKLKVSGCFRSWEGLRAFAAIQSFISTARKRSLNILESIQRLFCSVPVSDT